jgi:cytosine/adenosine deaminase-related metal-dependent hydrolase
VNILSADWVLPVDGAPIEHGAVALADGRIEAVGTQDELGRGEHFPGAAIIPGFVNAHSHLEYAVYAGFGEGRSVVPWLETHIERKRRIGVSEMEAIARLGAAQCLGSGITTVADASFSGAAAAACAELGLRAIVHLEVFGGPSELAESFEPTAERIVGSLSDRVQMGVSPHAPTTASLELYSAAHALGLPVATHLAESEAEREWLLEGTGDYQALADWIPPPAGTTGVRMLAAAGLLDERVVAAHCVTVDEEEIGLLAAAGAGVAHCPRSNAYLGCGIAPLRELLDAGVRVGLGTDSPASTPSFDMFDELRACLAAARARARSPEALGAAEALELATLGSARTLRLDDEIGSLKPGKQADLTVVSLAGTTFVPWEDPASAVVLGGSPGRVVATLVAGETRYRRGGMQWHELTDAALSARERLLRQPASSTSRR